MIIRDDIKSCQIEVGVNLKETKKGWYFITYQTDLLGECKYFSYNYRGTSSARHR